MSAIETANVLHAMAILDLTVSLAPAYINQRGFRGAISRVGVGVFDLDLELPLSAVGPLTDPTWKLGGMCLLSRRTRVAYPAGNAPTQWCATVSPTGGIRLQFASNVPAAIDPISQWHLLVFRFPQVN